jgi:hypothetical protein
MQEPVPQRQVSGGGARAQPPQQGAGIKVRRAVEAGSKKPPSRNKLCPCGSGQKHKNCCGAAKSRAGAAATAAFDDLAVVSKQLDTLCI